MLSPVAGLAACEQSGAACLLDVRAHYAVIALLARASPLYLFPRVRKDAVTPIMAVPLPAGQNLPNAQHPRLRMMTWLRTTVTAQMSDTLQ